MFADGEPTWNAAAWAGATTMRRAGSRSPLLAGLDRAAVAGGGRGRGLGRLLLLLDQVLALRLQLGEEVGADHVVPRREPLGQALGLLAAVLELLVVLLPLVGLPAQLVLLGQLVAAHVEVGELTALLL